MDKDIPLTLNRRKDNRYFVEGILVEGIGTIVEVSKNGFRILKDPLFSLTGPELRFKIATLEMKGMVRWEDQHYLGLEGATPLSNPAFLSKRLKRLREVFPPPQWKISPEQAITQYKKSEDLITLINLLLEVENPEPDIRKVIEYIEDVSAWEEREREKALREGSDHEDLRLGKTCKEELKAKALRLQARGDDEEMEVDFAIAFLGLHYVREVVEDHVRKRVFPGNEILPLFEELETYNILKSVLFKNFCRISGLSDLQSEGQTLLFFETAGLDILVKESKGILDAFYKSPLRLYSELSRLYERLFFSVDPLQITQTYLENFMPTLKELYHGYLLAYHALNPQYFVVNGLKITLSKKALRFSYVVYLTLLGILFVLDRDRDCGHILSRRLKGRGLTQKNQEDFWEQVAGETRSILRNLRIQGSVSIPIPSEGDSSLESFRGKDVRYDYLIRSFSAFSRNSLGRLALRYEDVSYAHFVLSKIINADELDLCGKTLVVIPCENLSDEPWYLKDFDHADLLVFKEIHKIPSTLLGSFFRLWNQFDGQIIVTFSTFEFLEHAQPQLFACLREHIVDFPSYFYNHYVHEKMIDHTIQYLKVFIGETPLTREKYGEEFYTMNHIKADILTTQEFI